jgi:hypothetical protein
VKVRRIEARLLVHAEWTAEENAQALTGPVLDALSGSDGVEISLFGIRGVSSTFFNALLGSIVDSLGPAALTRRVRFLCETPTQESVLRRSLDAVTASS